MQNRQGTKAQEAEGKVLLRISEYEQNYQEALRYRRRLSAGTLHLAECTKAQLLYHFDMLAVAATAWRAGLDV